VLSNQLSRAPGGGINIRLKSFGDLVGDSV
jgi:hypothetical protein